MAKTSMKIKQQRKQKFSTREYTRCLPPWGRWTDAVGGGG